MKTRDVRAEVARISRAQPVDEAARAVFIERRANMAAAVLASRSENMAERGRSLRTVADTTPPVPGGTGAGFGYSLDGGGDFVDGFVGGTSIGFDLIAQNPPGGNVNNFLYLTATNKAGLGVEAFLSYFGQGDPEFKVFDWALFSSNPWVVDLPWSALSDYLHVRTTHAMDFPVIPVWNSTFRLDPSTWRNEVHLHNLSAQAWDLIYQFDYAAVDADQQIPSVGPWFAGSWGPIVETFQADYSGTALFGHLAVQLSSADTNLVWSPWTAPTNVNTYVMGPDFGFTQVFLDENYAFVVTS